MSAKEFKKGRYYSQKIRIKRHLFLKLYHLLKFTFPSLAVLSSPTMSSKRLNLIRTIIKKDRINYLEIGIENANTFVNVQAEQKVGVDPFPLRKPPLRNRNMRIQRTTSEKFFKENSTIFDLIFVDGLHTYEQTYEDIINSFSTGSKECLILVDDVIPSDKFAALRSQLECQILKYENGIKNNYWMGDVFKILPLLSIFHSEISWATISEKNENPQLLLWRSPEGAKVVIENRLKEFKEIEGNYNFSDVFQDVIPEYFRIMSINDVLIQVQSDLY
jgi:hypothetical protein